MNCYALILFLAVTFVAVFEDVSGLTKCQYKILARDSGTCCKNDVLNIHNKYRKMALSGEIPGQPAAKTMPMLKWDSSLAAAAQQVADTCEFKHVTINSTKYGWVGQNLYTISYKGSPKLDLSFNYTLPVRNWFNEYKNYKYPDGPSADTGHYTQVVWANTQYVGCACTIYLSGEWLNKFYVCNYGPGGNYQGQPPYAKR